MRKNDLTEYYTLAQRAGYSREFTEYMLTAAAENGKTIDDLCNIIHMVIDVIEDSTLTE